MSGATTDAELLAAWSSGDSHAGQMLFKRHFRTVFAFFANKIERDVDDLVQRTFVAALESVASLRSATSFQAFVLGIARNQLLMYLRATYRLHAREAIEHRSVTDLGVRVTQLIAQRESSERLLAGLRSLPLELQIVLELHYWEELSSREIGEVLALPAPTVRSRLARGRELLARAVRELAPRSGHAVEADDLDGWAATIRAQLDRTLSQ